MFSRMPDPVMSAPFDYGDKDDSDEQGVEGSHALKRGDPHLVSSTCIQD